MQFQSHNHNITWNVWRAVFSIRAPILRGLARVSSSGITACGICITTVVVLCFSSIAITGLVSCNRAGGVMLELAMFLQVNSQVEFTLLVWLQVFLTLNKRA